MNIKTGFRYLALFYLLALFCPSYAYGGEQDDFLAKLVAKNQEISSLTAKYTQTKKLAVFKNEQKSSGRMILKKPGNLYWQSDNPKSELIVSGGRVSISSSKSGKTEKYDLKGNKPLKVMMENVIMLFSADVKKLEELYTLEIKSGKTGGSLLVVPRDKRVRKRLKSVELTVDTEYIVRKMTILDGKGDKTEMVFKDILINPVIDESIFQL